MNIDKSFATPHMSEMITKALQKKKKKSTAIIDFGIVYNLDIRLIYKNEIHE